MSLCIAIGAKVVTLAISAFTLTWTHSIEKTEWRESWKLGPDGLAIVEAHVAGSGAGMEPPPDAVRDGTGWRYTPHVPPQAKLVLGNSGKAGAWRLCASGRCLDLGDQSGEPIVLEPCP